MIPLLLAAGAAPLPATSAARQHGAPAQTAAKSAEDPANAAGAFALAEGVRVELFAAEPLLQNPVALSVDGRGRVLVVETHRYLRSVFDVVTYQPEWLPEDLGLRTVADRRAFLLRKFAADPSRLSADAELLRRLSDEDGDGRAERSEVLLRGFDAPECGPIAGVLAHAGGAFVTCVPELVRVDEGGAAQVLASGFGVHVGVSGHDLHGLALGPDGRLYFSLGDRGAHVRTREGELLDLPDTGGVYRCELDGAALEPFAIGLRNPQELSFDELGNLFTADNDTAGDDRSRVVHVAPGADYGWRCSYQHMEGFGPWVQEELWRGGIGGALPHAGYVAQGPSGLSYCGGAGWSEHWRGSFFVCDFPGGVLSFRVTPHGATFRTQAPERVVWNLWPTDAEFAPDGALLVSDWVAGWVQPLKGRIWRLRDTGADERALAVGRDAARILAADLSDWDVPARLALLHHADVRVRNLAHLSLATAGEAAQRALSELALDPEGDGLAQLHATWALAVAQRRAGQSNSAVLGALVTHRSAAVRAAAARAVGELRIGEARAQLVRGLKDSDARAAFECAVALARLGQRDPLRALGRPLTPAQPPTADAQAVRAALIEFAELRAEKDAYLAHSAALALAAWSSDEELATHAGAASSALRRVALEALRRTRSPLVARFLAGDTLAGAARAIHDDALEAAEPALAKLDALATPDLAAARRVLAARWRRGDDEDARSLTRAGLAGPPELARLALALLGAWADSGPLDPITGLWRPLPARDAAPAREALLAHFESLLSSAVASQSIDAARRLRGPELAPSLLAFVSNAQRDGALRANALEAWIELSGATLPAALGAELLEDPAPQVRRVALAHADPADPRVAERLAPLVRACDEDASLARVALARLAAGPRESCEAVLLAELQRWSERGEHPLALELIELSRTLGGAPLERALAELGAQPGPALEERALLAGGDPKAGKELFEQRAALECLRCHATARPGDSEGKVGPSLAGVGARLAPAELLESILRPNASIAESYATVVLVLDDESLASGIVEREDDSTLTLRTSDGERRELRQEWIESRRVGLSAMPEGLAQRLTAPELRDLVAYLRSLR